MTLDIVARGRKRSAPSSGRQTVVLASASKIRARMLLHAGISFETAPGDIDEAAVKLQARQSQTQIDNVGIALVLAQQKATQASRNFPGRLVIGADQILDLDGEIYDKPVDLVQARSRLARLSGRPHDLISAVSVARDGAEIWHHVDRARLWVRPLSDEFLGTYFDQLGDAAFKSPGSYQVEGIGVQLFDRIDGNYDTILGMPLLPLLKFLRTQKMIPS